MVFTKALLHYCPGFCLNTIKITFIFGVYVTVVCLIEAAAVLFYPEPNLLSGTAHSVNKRGVKRRDLDVEELKEILSPLLPFVRTEHILPTNSDVLSDAVSAFYFYLCCCVCVFTVTVIMTLALTYILFVSSLKGV